MGRVWQGRRDGEQEGGNRLGRGTGMEGEEMIMGSGSFKIKKKWR